MHVLRFAFYLIDFFAPHSHWPLIHLFILRCAANDIACLERGGQREGGRLGGLSPGCVLGHELIVLNTILGIFWQWAAIELGTWIWDLDMERKHLAIDAALALAISIWALGLVFMCIYIYTPNLVSAYLACMRHYRASHH